MKIKKIVKFFIYFFLSLVHDILIKPQNIIILCYKYGPCNYHTLTIIMMKYYSYRIYHIKHNLIYFQISWLKKIEYSFLIFSLKINIFNHENWFLFSPLFFAEPCWWHQCCLCMSKRLFKKSQRIPYHLQIVARIC